MGAASLKDFFIKKNNEEQADAVEEEIRSIIEEGHEQGAIQPDEAEMISNVFEFGDKQVRNVCCPRQKILGIEADTEIMDALNIMLENSYSRYPIYEEDIDNIIGVLHFKEAVVAYLNNTNQTVRDLGSAPYYVHPTQKIRKLFNEMKSSKNHLAIVVDEYGQTEGLITLEDILEVLVGDILDEHDEKENDIMKLTASGLYVVNGSAELEELEDLLGIEFPDEDINTVNGFMLYELGHLPEEKEQVQITYQGFSFVAIKWNEHMISKVRIRKLPQESVESANSEAPTSN